MSTLGAPLGLAGCGDDVDRLRRLDSEPTVEEEPAQGGEVTISPRDGNTGGTEPSSLEPESPPPLCSRAGTPCEQGATQACVLSCEAMGDGCVAFSHFVPLGRFPSGGYGLRFTALDPGGQYLYFSHHWSGGRWEDHPYTWSAAGGVESLDAKLGARSEAEGVSERFVTIVQVGSDGRSLLGLNIEDDSAQTGFLWTPVEGLTQLDFAPARMSSDLGVVVGLRNGRAVVWERAVGVRRLDGGDLDEAAAATADDAPALSASGEFATFRAADGTVFHWSAASGLTPLSELVGEDVLSAYTLRSDVNGLVIFGSLQQSGTSAGALFRWSAPTGLQRLGALAEMPAETIYSARFASDDGSVLVGTASSPGASSAIFRWTEAAGMQRVATGDALIYVSASGNTIVGYRYTEEDFTSFRWAEREGLTELDGDVRGGVALDGRLLLARSGSDGISNHEFGQALDDTGSTLIDYLPPRLTPEGWAGSSFEHVSDNARLFAGSASDPAGERQGWLLRLNRLCSE